MSKIRKIRDVEPKIRKVRELKKEEEIEVITRSEIPVEGDSIVNVEPVSSEFEERRAVSPRFSEGVPESMEVREEERIEESKMYEARGVALAPIEARTESAGKKYATAEAIHSDRMKQSSIGRGDFAVHQQGSLLPEGQTMQTEDKMREEVNDNKYSEGLSEAEGGGGKRKYPWEV